MHPEEHALGSFDLINDRLWYCTHYGEIGAKDLRQGRSKASVYEASEKKLNTVHVNPIDPNYLVTAGLDRIVRIFDIRNLKKEAEPLKSFEHGKSVNSAYWDPVFGKDIVSTSFDDTLGLWKDSLGDSSRHIIIKHNNNTGTFFIHSNKSRSMGA